MAVRVRDSSVRYPDLTIDCAADAAEQRDRVLREHRVGVEVLSPSTRDGHLGVKLAEYRPLPSVEAIAFVDPEAEIVAITRHTPAGGWTDIGLREQDLDLPPLHIVVPHAEIFARD